MNKIKLNTDYQKLLADTVTPVSIYLKLRDRYEKPILLESSDYHGSDNSFSYICCDPIASLEVKSGNYKMTLPNEVEEGTVANDEAHKLLNQFSSLFQTDKNPFKFINYNNTI